MKSSAQRAVNVLALAFLAFAIYMPFGTVGDALDGFARVIAFGVPVILSLNYIFFGKVTLWNRGDDQS